MKQILIITNSKDLTVDYLIDRYSESAHFFRLNTDCFSDYNFLISNNGSTIKYNDNSLQIDMELCDSLYYRKISFPSLREYDSKYRNLMQREMVTIIEGIAETFGNIGMTRPSFLRRADNKIVQLKLANELGFNIPDSLISNSNQEAKIFTFNNPTSIVKPISVGRLIDENKVGYIQTNMVNKEQEILGLELSPAYFQSYQEKDYEVRLTIINGKPYGVKINSSNNIDWRKKDSKISYSLIEVPQEIVNKCLIMMDSLYIKFAAFDFIVKDGNYFFLELNANGQWLWLEEELNLDISGSIINYLLGDL
ncbi:MvdC/MvdD family ATP grasp protein [Neobacillus rhizosphaerae]|uniref:MvdC/MvdD family ATP grasp protein n=1 Tax=Neobacillus rhizosphaerae TaxID=2880965 RepID=UPI003D2719A5